MHRRQPAKVATMPRAAPSKHDSPKAKSGPLEIDTGWVPSGEAVHAQITIRRPSKRGRVQTIVLELSDPHLSETGAREAADRYADGIRQDPDRLLKLFD
jgi:hypothetical protein